MPILSVNPSTDAFIKLANQCFILAAKFIALIALHIVGNWLSFFLFLLVTL
jgi:hypothetical protein